MVKDTKRFIPRISRIGEYYDDKQIESFFELENQDSADAYGHYESCQWFLAEDKTTAKLDEVEEQLNNTLIAIKKKKPEHCPKYIFLIADTLSRNDQDEYTIKTINDEPFKIIQKKGSKKIIRNSDGRPIYFIYKHEINSINGRLSQTGIKDHVTN